MWLVHFFEIGYYYRIYYLHSLHTGYWLEDMCILPGSQNCLLLLCCMMLNLLYLVISITSIVLVIHAVFDCETKPKICEKNDRYVAVLYLMQLTIYECYTEHYVYMHC